MHEMPPNWILQSVSGFKKLFDGFNFLQTANKSTLTRFILLFYSALFHYNNIPFALFKKIRFLTSRRVLRNVSFQQRYSVFMLAKVGNV